MAKSAILEHLTLGASRHSGPSTTIPAFIYGTAWKKDLTANLVYQAVSNGFRGIDTANQPKHYREDLVGDGLRRTFAERKIRREDLYIQTKFTSIAGQDPSSIPYDHTASIADQVKASVESSLKHLKQGAADTSDGQSYLDTLLLHSPLSSIDETMEAWHTLEDFVPTKIRNLGISNCNLFTLMDLCERANIRPAVVQNRFYSSTRFDIGVRKFCRENHIIYQCFWTLTANPQLVWATEVGQLANQLGISPQAALYCMILSLENTVILNGTTSAKHMQEDLQALEMARTYARKEPERWKSLANSFRASLGEPA